MPMNRPHSDAARVFRALGDDTRLKMLAYLRVRELCVCELTGLVGLSQPAVSEHLRRLKDAGLVVDDRRGTWSFYRLSPDLPAYAAAALGTIPEPLSLHPPLAPTPPASCSTSRGHMARPTLE